MSMQISPAAEQKIIEILNEEKIPNSRLRMYVEGGGCSGMQYGFVLETENSTDDLEIQLNQTAILVDPISFHYLQNIILDYKNDLEGSRFVINNPDVTSTCSCGSSFSYNW